MLEATVAATLAVFTALAAVTNRIHKRIDEVQMSVTTVDRRVDTAELSMARHYVYKEDFEKAFQKMESHMVRIENKLDQMMMNNG
jgi:heme oxygenase